MNSLPIKLSDDFAHLKSVIYSEDLSRQQEDKASDQQLILSQEPPRSWSAQAVAWYKGTNPLHDKISELLKMAIREHLTNTFQVSYDDKESIAIDHTFEELLIANECQYADLNKINVVRKLLDNIPRFIVMVNRVGAEIKLQKEETANIPPDVVHVINHLLGDDFDTKFLSWGLIKSALFSSDRERNVGFKQCLEVIMNKIYLKLKAGHCNTNDEAIYVAIINEMMYAISSAEPENGDTVKIPQKINDVWELVEYKMELIPLSSEWIGVVPALGLKPVENKSAQPILLFRPTPQPSSQGALVAFAADGTPGKTIGEVLYDQESVKNRIQDWAKKAFIEYQALNKRNEADSKEMQQRGVKVGGKSMGGILAIIAASHQPQYLTEVLVSGAPTPFSAVRNVYEAQTKKESAKPTFTQLWSYGDEVPLRGNGYYAGTKVYKVIPPNAKTGMNAHMAYAIAVNKAIVVEVDAEIDARTKTRKNANIVDQISNCIFFPVFIGLLGVKLLTNIVLIGPGKVWNAVVGCFGAVPQQPRLAFQR